MKKTILFIGGSSYSGSTMLDMMLSNTKQGFSVGEVHALFRPYRPHHFKPICGCATPNCNIWEKIRDRGEQNLYQSVFNEFKSTEYIVDSSKNPYWIERQTKNALLQGYEVYNIVIWKNPVDFCSSMIKRNRKGCIKAWKNYYKLYMTIIENWTSISYKDLATDPALSLIKLCDSIGINYETGMENYWNKQHHTLFGNDSAKVHLFNSSNELEVEDKTFSSLPKTGQINNDSEKHRSIYYNSDNNNVSSIIRNKIKQDIVVNDIFSELLSGSSRTEPQYNNRKYNKHKLTIIRLSYNIKYNILHIIGKYLRIM